MTCDRHRKAFVNGLFDKLTGLQDDVRTSETFSNYVDTLMREYDFRNALVQLYGQDLIEELNDNYRLEVFYNDSRKEMENG